MLSRVVHRRLGLLSLVFLLFAAGTGVWLEGARLADAVSGDPGHAGHGPPVVFDAKAYASAVSTAVDAARQRAPDRAIAEIRLRSGHKHLRAMVQLSGAPDRQIVIDGATGVVEKDGPKGGDNWLVHLHDGEALGPFGLALALLWGCALLGMSFTGLCIWAARWRQLR